MDKKVYTKLTDTYGFDLKVGGLITDHSFDFYADSIPDLLQFSH